MFCVSGVPGLVVGTELRLELLFGWKEEIKKNGDGDRISFIFALHPAVHSRNIGLDLKPALVGLFQNYYVHIYELIHLLNISSFSKVLRFPL